MVKKLFALASVTALTGLVAASGLAGCSDSTDNAGGGGTDDASTVKDAGRDRTQTPVGDDEDPPVELPECLSTDPIDPASIPYAKAGLTPDACTDAEAAAIKKFLDDAIKAQKFDFTQSEWAATVSEKCGKCVFTEVDAASWGLIIGNKDQFFTYNRGGCIEAVSGNEACGQAYHNVEFCFTAACNSCQTQDEFDACTAEQDAIFDGPCAGYIENAQKACGANLGAYLDACKDGPIQDGIPAVCIQGGSPDAGNGG